ncbi:MAG: hypothetical protein CMI63_02565 [Parvularcula sp.]|nr:hypothetical protein [Parvularcula sp.]
MFSVFGSEQAKETPKRYISLSSIKEAPLTADVLSAIRENRPEKQSLHYLSTLFSATPHLTAPATQVPAPSQLRPMRTVSTVCLER